MGTCSAKPRPADGQVACHSINQCQYHDDNGEDARFMIPVVVRRLWVFWIIIGFSELCGVTTQKTVLFGSESVFQQLNHYIHIKRGHSRFALAKPVIRSWGSSVDGYVLEG
jgi:hypothetical protein